MDTQQAPPVAAKNSFVSKMASSVANHPYISLAIIVVLSVLVIGAYVYYHGFLCLGPYAAAAEGFRAGAKKAKGGKPRRAAEADASDPDSDAETERLIDSINSR
jgi:hypothetical protein